MTAFVSVGHKLDETREDGLAFCLRCRGGEIDLQEPCAERMERKLLCMEAGLKLVTERAESFLLRANLKEKLEGYSGAVMHEIREIVVTAQANAANLPDYVAPESGTYCACRPSHND